jgi:septal ring factor EnvC (AmiA/AmiB activator)
MLPCTCVTRASLHVYATSMMSSVLTEVKTRSPAQYHSTLTHQLLQASINELEVVVDESNVQMSSLREQLDAAQQRLDVAEAGVTALQATETNLQQQLRSTQVG